MHTNREKPETYLNWIKEFIWYFSQSSFGVHGLWSCNFCFSAKLNKFLYNSPILTYSMKDICCSTKPLQWTPQSDCTAYSNADQRQLLENSLQQIKSLMKLTWSLYDRPSLEMAAGKMEFVSPLARWTYMCTIFKWII